MKVCVVGAGVIGCATAYQLLRSGYEVTLVDGASQAGSGTSYANGGQLSYSFVEPLASPGTLRGLPKMLFTADSPVRFKLMPDPKQWDWGIRFLLACTGERSREGTLRLLRLARLSRSTLDFWLEVEGWQFGHRTNGKLVLCPTQASLDHQIAQVVFQHKHGCVQEVVSRDDCVRLEPALRSYASSIAGGVWTQDECVGDSHLLCRQMVESIRDMGGSVRLGQPVESLATERGRVCGVKTSTEILCADAVVLAAGTRIANLAEGAGLALPIYPIKGYSLTLDVKPGQCAPQVSVTDLGRKTVFAPLAGQLRVAAIAEMVGHDLSISRRRIDQMITSVETVYPDLCEFAEVRPWAGLRPATPDSLPIIGESKVPGLFINSGHGALGFTLAAGSAVELCRKLATALPLKATSSSRQKFASVG